MKAPRNCRSTTAAGGGFY